MPPVEAPPRRAHAERQPGERRTIVIRGQVAPLPGPDPIRARRRRPPRRASERIAGSRPDRAAMWAVLMGVFLIMVAVLTAHGA
jgi:hypothetical protein